MERNYSFSELSEEEKHQVRIKYTEYINALNDEVIVSDRIIMLCFLLE